MQLATFTIIINGKTTYVMHVLHNVKDEEQALRWAIKINIAGGGWIKKVKLEKI